MYTQTKTAEHPTQNAPRRKLSELNTNFRLLIVIIPGQGNCKMSQLVKNKKIYLLQNKIPLLTALLTIHCNLSQTKENS